MHLYVVCYHFICSYVAVSRPCRLSKFYPNRTSTRPTSGWEAGEGGREGDEEGEGEGMGGVGVGVQVWGLK